MSPKPSPRTNAVAAVAALLLLLCAPARAQEAREIEITYGSHNIVFTPPPGCNAVPEKTLTAAFAGRPVKYGCFTPGEGRGVFVFFLESDGSKNGLAEFERGYKDGIKQGAPAVQFKRRVVNLGGLKWVALRYTQGAGQADMTNDIYMIDWAGQIILFDFVAPASKYEGSRAALEASAKSIRLSISVIAPAATPESPGGGRD